MPCHWRSVDLETNGGQSNPGMATALETISAFTNVVFTFEVLVKLVAESWHPERYFTDPNVSITFKTTIRVW